MSGLDLGGLIPDDGEPTPTLKAVPLKPGQKPPAIDPEKEFLLLTPTAQRAYFAFSGWDGHDCLIRAEATLKGGEHALFFDDCRRFVVLGVTAQQAGHGIRLRGGGDAVLKDCRATANRIEGCIIGGVKNVTIVNLKTWRNGFPGNDRAHGLYLSYQSEDVVVEGVESTGNAGAGIHCNSPTDEQGVGPMRRVTVRHAVLRGNGSGGTGNADWMYTQVALLEDSLIEGGVGGASTWADSSPDPGKGAKRITIRRCTILNERWALRLQVGGDVTVESSIVAGPTSKDASSRWAFDSKTLRGTVQKALAEWVDPATLKSRVAGVGWE